MFYKKKSQAHHPLPAKEGTSSLGLIPKPVKHKIPGDLVWFPHHHPELLVVTLVGATVSTKEYGC